MKSSTSPRGRAFAAITTAVALALAGHEASAQTASAIDATRVVLPFSQLLASPEGRAVLSANLETTVAINNNSSAAQRTQAIADNALLGGALSISVALGSKLDGVFTAASAANGDPVLQATGIGGRAIRALAGLALSNSVTAKNYFANGTSNGTVPFVGLPLPPGGQFNIYDNAYGIVPFSQNPLGDSRPYQVVPDRLVAVNPALFGGSNNTSSAFPSGHSTVGFSEGILLAMMVPERYSEIMYRGSEEGFSRLVLGVHYVTDVIGGRIIATQQISSLLNNLPAYLNAGTGGATTADPAGLFAQGTAAVRQVLEAGCASSVAACASAGVPDRFSNYAAMRADYLYRMTYNLPALGPTNLAPVVPVGAEALIATRYPYLSAAQRRDVLATTEVASGAALDDGSGWARLNLFDAVNGYGVLSNTAISANMNAALGGFNALDTWRNSISGTGSLVKTGTGTLVLAGTNTFSGPVTISGGTLAITGAGTLPATAALTNTARLSMVDGSPTGRVTVASYTGGAGSVLAVDAALSGATPNADRLIITGTTAGGPPTVILVNDLTPNGAGVPLGAGIPIVVTATPAAFALGGTASKGLFDYTLSGATPGVLALTSTPSDEGERLATIPTALEETWSASANVWLDRQAARRQNGDTSSKAVWGSAFGRWLDRDQGASGYDMHPAGVLAGVDVNLGETSGARVGVLVGYVDAQQDFDSGGTSIEYRGLVAGITASFTGASGLFADLQIKLDALKASIESPGLASLGSAKSDVDVQNLGFASTFGYHLDLAGRGWLEPLLGLQYLRASDSLEIAGNAVEWDVGHGLLGRAGARGGLILSSSDSHSFSLTGQIIGNVYNSRPETRFTAIGGSFTETLEDSRASTFMDLGAGLQYESGRWSTALRAGYRYGQGYNARDVSLSARLTF